MTEMDMATEVYLSSVMAGEASAKLRKLYSYMLGDDVSDDRVVVELQYVDGMLHGMRDRLLQIRKEIYHGEKGHGDGRLRDRQGGE